MNPEEILRQYAGNGAHAPTQPNPMGLLSQQQPNGDWVTPIHDGLGNVRALVDQNLNVLETRNYGPYGILENTQGVPQTPYGFTGEMTDDNGLVHLRARYYDPALGVFPSPDPLPGNIQEAMSLNPYMYVHGNPVNDATPKIDGFTQRHALRE